MWARKIRKKDDRGETRIRARKSEQERCVRAKNRDESKDEWSDFVSLSRKGIPNIQMTNRLTFVRVSSGYSPVYIIRHRFFSRCCVDIHMYRTHVYHEWLFHTGLLCVWFWIFLMWVVDNCGLYLRAAGRIFNIGTCYVVRLFVLTADPITPVIPGR